MRARAFPLGCHPGCDTMADTRVEYPEPRLRSLSLHAPLDTLRRVDHVTGSADGQADSEAAFLGSSHTSHS